jgi:N-acyl-D-aspartate/D-glutamate deacylase
VTSTQAPATGVSAAAAPGRAEGAGSIEVPGFIDSHAHLLIAVRGTAPVAF